MFPESNRQSGRLYSLSDRIVDCFLRSENATGAIADSGGGDAGAPSNGPEERNPAVSDVEGSGRARRLHHLAGSRGGGRQQSAVARPEHHRRHRVLPTRSSIRERRSDVQGTMRRRATASMAKASPSATRKPGRSGNRLLERRRRGGARLHAGGHHAVYDAVSRSGEHLRRKGAGPRRLHQLQAPSRPSRSKSRTTSRKKYRSIAFITLKSLDRVLGDHGRQGAWREKRCNVLNAIT